MIKMIIVDDEPIICQGLRYTVPWGDYGIEVVDEAYNGEEALEKLDKNENIGILLTDVKMPKMDGLELARKIYSRPNPPKIIILSGYEEFEYAKKALQTGVKDYLLKPVNIDELLAIVESIVDELKEEQKNEKYLNQLIVKSLVDPRVFGASLEKSSLTKINKDKNVYPIVSCTKDYGTHFKNKTEIEILTYKENWKNEIERVLQKAKLDSFSLFTQGNLLLTCIYSSNKEMPSVQQMKKVLSEFNIAGYDYQYVLADKRYSMDKLIEIYMEMEHSLLTGLTKNTQFIILNKEKQPCNTNVENLRMNEEKIIELLFNKEKERLDHEIELLFKKIEVNQIQLDMVLKYSMNLIKQITTHPCMAMNEESSLLLKLYFLQDCDVFTCNSYLLLKQAFQQDVDIIYHHLQMADKENSYWLIERALQYIQNHYMYDLKASEVAYHINISPNYFSSLFNQYTKMHFNDYLNELRVEKSKQLLKETTETVTNIAESVGYTNYKYFIHVFKKRTKITPTDYRRMLVKDA
ncbi:response regulator transcription factor [Aquibacillus kalidii]|uniref:response regulator transcription factor n=1 Tax=Aquibacillus kalidii TaxID=2762597 RepID=UPI0016458D81|nr:response regulator [Aquibacillus kalidii]